jgi:hypothetical protein
MNIFSKVNHVPFKYVAGMNIAILVMAATFMSINTVGQTTENRSQAAAETPLPSPLAQITVDPSNPPKLLASDPDWAKVGDAIVIRGENLGTVPFGQLYIGNTQITMKNIVEWNPSYIVITLPGDTISNPLTLSYNQDQLLQTSNVIRVVEINETGL